MLHVFYSQNTRDTGMYGMLKDSPKKDRMRVKCMVACADPENYVHVATLDGARDFEDVWEAMQGEVSDIPRKLQIRSMMVGDIIVNPATLEAFVVDSVGFDLFDFADAEAFMARATGKPVMNVGGET